MSALRLEAGPPVRDALRRMRAYSLELNQATTKIDQNENPLDFPEEWKAEVARRAMARGWNRYPDFELRDLRSALASKYGFGIENILVGNGSNEMLFAALATFVDPGRTVFVLEPTFPLYEKIATIMGGEIERIPFDPRLPAIVLRREVLERIRRADRPVVVICSPNNPTGGVIDPTSLSELLDSDATLLLDRAYGEFAGQEHLPLHPRLITFSTFSKAWGLAGLRIGWIAATEQNCLEVRKVSLPYTLNVFSEEAALFALEQSEAVSDRLRMLLEQRDWLSAELASIEGVEPFPSRANFIAFEVEEPVRVFRELISRSVLIRNISGYPGMQRALRVSVGTCEENRIFISALRQSLSQRSQS